MSSCAYIHTHVYHLIKNINVYYMLHSVIMNAKSSKKNERRQVNKKFNKLERVYRDCIKKDKRQDHDNTVYRKMHQAFDA